MNSSRETIEDGAATVRALCGYASRWSAAAGESVEFFVTAEAPFYDVDIVRLSGRLVQNDGRGAVISEPVPEVRPFRTKGIAQRVRVGSYIELNLPPLTSDEDVSIQCWFRPTTLRSPTTLFSWSSDSSGGGIELGVVDGVLVRRKVEAGTARVTRDYGVPIPIGSWSKVQWGLRGVLNSGAVAVLVGDTLNTCESQGSDGLTNALAADRSRFSIGGTPWRGGEFDGKVECPKLLAQSVTGWVDSESSGTDTASTLATWDLSALPAYAAVPDRGSLGADGRLVNGGQTAVTGRAWTGDVLDYRLAPNEYSAVALHRTDLDDVGWESGWEITLPPTSPSGIYAARLRTDADEVDLIPFIVRPHKDQTKDVVCVVLPTLTYSAYANFAVKDVKAELFTGTKLELDPRDHLVHSHPDFFGLSLYNRHIDGSGVAIASTRRPMLTVRPDYGFWLCNGAGWGLSGDLYLIDWLERTGYPYVVLTDDDLDENGPDLISEYRVVITGSHPEYMTHRVLTAWKAYLEDGGRMMYLGGNGFYWVMSRFPDRPHLYEVRRGQSGSRPWSSEPGEANHASSGEPGGLWRHRGNPPQALTGVGFCAQGGGEAAGYRRTTDSYDPRAGFIFEGMDAVEMIGVDEGPLGGAAGIEVDRADVALGTPPHALVVASSAGLHSDLYQRAVEEIEVMTPGQGGQESGGVRADIVFFETPSGGAVFSVGSIAWSMCLGEGRSTTVGQITANVLDRFRMPQCFEIPAPESRDAVSWNESSLFRIDS